MTFADADPSDVAGAILTPFDQAYRHAKDTAAWAMTHVQGRSLQPTISNRLAGAAYGLALEHQRSMTVLVEAKAYGSALTLLRPVVEGFALGYWLLYQASEAQIIAFAEGKSTLTLDVLLRRIADEHTAGPEKGQLQKLVKWLNSMTHGGVEHLVMRQSKSTVGPQYTIEDMASALSIGAWVAKMAALDIVGGVVGDVERATQMLSEVDGFRPVHAYLGLSPTA